jgi:thiamine pyrophosphokinase
MQKVFIIQLKKRNKHDHWSLIFFYQLFITKQCKKNIRGYKWNINNLFIFIFAFPCILLNKTAKKERAYTLIMSIRYFLRCIHKPLCYILNFNFKEKRKENITVLNSTDRIFSLNQIIYTIKKNSDLLSMRIWDLSAKKSGMLMSQMRLLSLN